MEEKTTMYWTVVVLTLISMITLTFFHDPILHSFPALLFGWSVKAWHTGIMTGWTNVETVDPTTIELWIFYMLPAMILTSIALVCAFVKPIRKITVPASILFLLNMASLNPTIGGSDSYKALQVLIDGGMNPALANIIQYGIFILFIVGLGTFLFIVSEDDEPESQRRGDYVLNQR